MNVTRMVEWIVVSADASFDVANANFDQGAVGIVRGCLLQELLEEIYGLFVLAHLTVALTDR